MSGSSSGRSTGYIDKSMYIYQIPLSVFKSVCSCLDSSDMGWEEVAHEMKYDDTYIIVSRLASMILVMTSLSPVGVA